MNDPMWSMEGYAALAGAAILFMSGCATAGFAAAQCQRMRYHEFNVLACDDDAVDAYCHKHGKTWDDGKPLDSRRIRACQVPSMFGRKPSIAIGKSYMNCLTHELAHLDGLDPLAAEKSYPCIGDGP